MIDIGADRFITISFLHVIRGFIRSNSTQWNFGANPVNISYLHMSIVVLSCFVFDTADHAPDIITINI